MDGELTREYRQWARRAYKHMRLEVIHADDPMERYHWLTTPSGVNVWAMVLEPGVDYVKVPTFTPRCSERTQLLLESTYYAGNFIGDLEHVLAEFARHVDEEKMHELLAWMSM
jgi:hypothetical protein